MSKVNKFRKKPVVIEAIIWTGENYEELAEWLSNSSKSLFRGSLGSLVIPTKEGDMIASPGDWIIKGVKGEFYPCKPDIFELTYEDTEIRCLHGRPLQPEGCPDCLHDALARQGAPDDKPIYIYRSPEERLIYFPELPEPLIIGPNASVELRWRKNA